MSGVLSHWKARKRWEHDIGVFVQFPPAECMDGVCMGFEFGVFHGMGMGHEGVSITMILFRDGKIWALAWSGRLSIILKGREIME